MSTPAIQLAPGVFRIPTVGKDLVSSFALLEDDGSVTLVDTGLKRAPAKIVAALESIGKHPRDVTRIVLTHVHPDHAGGAAEMSRQTGAPVLVHGDDHDWATTGRITGAQDKSTRLGRLMSRTGDAKIEPFTPGPALTDGEVLPVAGGLRDIHTPGHSPVTSRCCTSRRARSSRGTPSSTGGSCAGPGSRRHPCAGTSR